MNTETNHITLKTQKLTVGYSSKKDTTIVAKEINFSISEGELVGLVGTNGIGKSTLLRTLAGIQPALNGAIFINNVLLKKYSTLQLANKLSVVLTEAPASKNLSVLELVSLGRSPYTNWVGKLSDRDKMIVKNAITVTEIEALINKKCYELSDGQLQRVLIARALAQDTPLILLDEPTTHLDIYHRAYILKLLKKLVTETNKTILFSTHEIDLAIQLSDKMLVMTPEKIFYNSPEKLIEAGCFSKLFPEETICFDKKSKRFILKN